MAEAYLQFLYSPKAQAVVAKHFYRPSSRRFAAEDLARFPKVNMFNIEKVFGGWAKAQKEHFGEGGAFDQILKSAGRG